MNKDKRYERIYFQLKDDLLTKCEDRESRMSTIAALLHHKFDYYFWTGYYMLVEGRLLVRAYQGPVACMELKKDTGVCWAAINQGKTLIVDDVHEFPGHIACSSLSRSEIVVPLFDPSGEIIGVMDIDSKSLASFDISDQKWLEEILKLI